MVKSLFYATFCTTNVLHKSRIRNAKIIFFFWNEKKIEHAFVFYHPKHSIKTPQGPCTYARQTQLNEYCIYLHSCNVLKIIFPYTVLMLRIYFTFCLINVERKECLKNDWNSETQMCWSLAVRVTCMLYSAVEELITRSSCALYSIDFKILVGVIYFYTLSKIFHNAWSYRQSSHLLFYFDHTI